MWADEIHAIYEGYRGLSVDQTPHVKGVSAPTIAKAGLTYKNNKLGIQTPNIAASSLAGDVAFGNPYEQEEVIEGSIPKQEICKIIDEMSNSLDSSNPTDRVAIMALNQLKTRIK
jgi:hypothetical protein